MFCGWPSSCAGAAGALSQCSIPPLGRQAAHGPADRRLSPFSRRDLAGRASTLRGPGPLGTEPGGDGRRLLRFTRRPADRVRRRARRIVRRSQCRGARAAVQPRPRPSRNERGARIWRQGVEGPPPRGAGARAVRRRQGDGLWAAAAGAGFHRLLGRDRQAGGSGRWRQTRRGASSGSRPRSCASRSPIS